MRIFELMEDPERYYIVSEYIRGGELYERLVTLKSFTEGKAAKIVAQLALAVNYMH